MINDFEHIDKWLVRLAIGEVVRQRVMAPHPHYLARHRLESPPPGIHTREGKK